MENEMEDEQVIEARVEVSERLGLYVLSLVCYCRNGVAWELETTDGKVFIGGTETLLQQDAVRRLVFETLSRTIPIFSPSDWLRIVDMLGELRVDRDEVHPGYVRVSRRKVAR